MPILRGSVDIVTELRVGDLMESLDATALRRLAHGVLHVRELARAASGVYRHALAVSRRRRRPAGVFEAYLPMEPVSLRPSITRVGRGAHAVRGRDGSVPEGRLVIPGAVPGRAHVIPVPTGVRRILETLPNMRSATMYHRSRSRIAARHDKERTYRPKLIPEVQAQATHNGGKRVSAFRATKVGMRVIRSASARPARRRVQRLADSLSPAAAMVRPVSLIAPRRTVASQSDRRETDRHSERHAWPHGSDRRKPGSPEHIQPIREDLEDTDVGPSMVDYLERLLLRPRRGMTGVDPRVMPF